jgi:hypothetical protein
MQKETKLFGKRQGALSNYVSGEYLVQFSGEQCLANAHVSHELD